MQQKTATLALIVCVIFWSTSGLVVKLVPHLDALAINGVRNFFTAAIMLIYLRRPNFQWSFPQLGGAVITVLMQFFFLRATQLTSAANAIVLQYTAPIFVAIFGIWYLKEYPKPIDWWTIAVIAVGMLLFFGDSLNPASLQGNLYGVLAGVALAWLILLLRKQKDGSPLETLLLGSIFATLAGIPALRRTTLQLEDWLLLVYMGVLQLGVPSLLYGLVIKYLGAMEASLIQTLEPILNPLWVFWVVGELPGRWTLVGGACVIGAVIVRALVASCTTSLADRALVASARPAENMNV